MPLRDRTVFTRSLALHSRLGCLVEEKIAHNMASKFSRLKHQPHYLIAEMVERRPQQSHRSTLVLIHHIRQQQVASILCARACEFTTDKA